MTADDIAKLLRHFGYTHGCREIEVETTTEHYVVEMTEVDSSKSSLSMSQGVGPMIEVMKDIGAQRMMLIGEGWVELSRDGLQTDTYTLRQARLGGSILSSTFEWSTNTMPQTSFSHPSSVRSRISEPTVTSSSPVVQQTNSKRPVLGGQFRNHFSVRYPYVAGAMAGGIASVEMVRTLSRHNVLSFFGAGGLSLLEVEKALEALSEETGIWGCNLLHNPVEPKIEEQTVDLLLHHKVRYVSASAFMQITPALVRYRLHGIHKENDRIIVPNQVFAKVSHPSVVQQFLRPPNPRIVERLLADGIITKEQALLAGEIPMADAITVEADSGGHTDSRPLSVILPTVLQMRNDILATFPSRNVFVGAAGGLAEPRSIKGAFAMGADYVLLGSVHQCTVEAGTSDVVKEMLAKSDVTDCALGIAPDMFEIGAHVQVLKKGTMYAQRSKKLHTLYHRFTSIETIPDAEKDKLEKQIFGQSLDNIWAEVQTYWQRDPSQIERANRDPKHKMALVFRWYLGNSSRWARQGDVSRKKDFQVWCGPSMGSFNRWVKGTQLEDWRQRTVVRLVDGLMQAVEL